MSKFPRLKNDVYLDKMARAMLGRVKCYFSQNPALAKQRVASSDRQHASGLLTSSETSS
jgi:hypothetical protein